MIKLFGAKWSRDELISAFNIYCKIPFAKIGSNNTAVKELAILINRSPSAVAFKLVNFASLDPALQERHISGMSHVSKADIEIWKEFHDNWEELAYQSELILAKFKKVPIEQSSLINTADLPREGKERESIVRIRVNQSFFRQMVLTSYDHRCCITGTTVPGLLIASHIIPWVADKRNRMNPCNGLCLNALHDSAFDQGLITITVDYRLKLSLALQEVNASNLLFFIPFEGKRILLPQRFLPSADAVAYHNKYIFIK
jgi:putative restriction endonuclease